jgi:hypothetical protein
MMRISLTIDDYQALSDKPFIHLKRYAFNRNHHIFPLY